MRSGKLKEYSQEMRKPGQCKVFCTQCKMLLPLSPLVIWMIKKEADEKMQKKEEVKEKEVEEVDPFDKKKELNQLERHGKLIEEPVIIQDEDLTQDLEEFKDEDGGVG
jgi:hypothetical protein